MKVLVVGPRSPCPCCFHLHSAAKAALCRRFVLRWILNSFLQGVVETSSCLGQACAITQQTYFVLTVSDPTPRSQYEDECTVLL